MENDAISRIAAQGLDDERIAELREAVFRVALGGSTQDVEMVTQIGPDGQPMPVATKSVKREHRPDVDLIREILNPRDRIGGPQDYC